MKNLFSELPGDLSAEVVETLLAADSLRIERIVSHGQASPEGFWYDQEEAEWVLLLQGAAVLEIEGAEHKVELARGDFFNIPSHQRHRVAETTPEEPTIWLAIFYREKQAALNRIASPD